MNVVLFFFNFLIKQGKKQTIIAFLLNFLLFFKRLNGFKFNLIKLLILLFYKIIPVVGFLTYTKSGKKYKIPSFLSFKKLAGLGFKWFFKNATLRKEKTLFLKIVGEITDIFNNKSNTLKQRKEFHNLAFENKQYLYLVKKRKRRF